MGAEDDLLAGMSDETPIARAVADAASWLGPGIEGVGEGRTEEGEPCIVVLVSELDPQKRAQLPREHHGFPVVLSPTGPIVALDDDDSDDSDGDGDGDGDQPDPTGTTDPSDPSTT